MALNPKPPVVTDSEQRPSDSPNRSVKALTLFQSASVPGAGSHPPCFAALHIARQPQSSIFIRGWRRPGRAWQPHEVAPPAPRPPPAPRRAPPGPQRLYPEPRSRPGPALTAGLPREGGQAAPDGPQRRALRHGRAASLTAQPGPALRPGPPEEEALAWAEGKKKKIIK